LLNYHLIFKENMQIDTSTTEIWDIVDHVQRDIHVAFDKAIKTESPIAAMISQYNGLLENIVFEVTTLPINREDAEIEDTLDPYDVADAYRQILDMVGTAFGYPIKKIEADLHNIILCYSVDDMRTLRKMQRAGTLH
jgi:hypothetical protein